MELVTVANKSSLRIDAGALVVTRWFLAAFALGQAHDHSRIVESPLNLLRNLRPPDVLFNWSVRRQSGKFAWQLPTCRSPEA